MTELLPLASIRRDLGTQPRSALHLPAIASYKEAYLQAQEQGDVPGFPPLVVFYTGNTYVLADGFHRAAMYEELGLHDVPCDVKPGTVRDAVLYSVGANARHGLHRTIEDKKRAVHRLLEDEEWSAWSDREIARRCAVSHPFVAQLRAERKGQHTGNGFQYEGERRFVHHKTGEASTMDVSRIGRMPGPKIERDRVATRPAPGIVATYDEPGQAPEYDEDSRQRTRGPVFQPRPTGREADLFAEARKAMLLLPPQPADVLAGVPNDFDADQAYELASWWDQLGEALERRSGSTS